MLKCIVENSEIAWVKQGQFQNFQKSRGWFIPKIARTKHVITGSSHQTNKHFGLKLIPFISGQLQITEWTIRKQHSCNLRYKIAPLTVQCRLQQIVWLIKECNIFKQTVSLFLQKFECPKWENHVLVEFLPSLSSVVLWLKHKHWESFWFFSRNHFLEGSLTF